jgi:hypothetical protein
MISPLDRFISSTTTSSRGSELSIVKGMRSGLPATAKVGTSKLVNSTSGSRVSAPVGTANTGTSRMRSRVAACEGGWPVFQSPSLINTTALRFGCCSSTLSERGMNVRAFHRGVCDDENGSMTTSMRSFERLPRVFSISGFAAVPHARSPVCREVTSFVLMLPETSCQHGQHRLRLRFERLQPLRLQQV